MKIKELIEILNLCDQEADVFAIEENSFYEVSEVKPLISQWVDEKVKNKEIAKYNTNAFNHFCEMRKVSKNSIIFG